MEISGSEYPDSGRPDQLSSDIRSTESDNNEVGLTVFSLVFSSLTSAGDASHSRFANSGSPVYQANIAAGD